MIEPIDIALAIHRICEETLIPNGISPKHDISAHSDTTAFYANYINGVLPHVTGKQVVEAIIEVSGWDMRGPWPGHPHPDLVIKHLQTPTA